MHLGKENNKSSDEEEGTLPGTDRLNQGRSTKTGKEKRRKEEWRKEKKEGRQGRREAGKDPRAVRLSCLRQKRVAGRLLQYDVPFEFCAVLDR